MIHVKSINDTLQIFTTKCPGLVNLELLQTRKVVLLEIYEEIWNFESIQSTFNQLPSLKKLVLIRNFKCRFDATLIKLIKFNLKEITRKCNKPLKAEIDLNEFDFNKFGVKWIAKDADGYTKMTITIKEQ